MSQGDARHLPSDAKSPKRSRTKRHHHFDKRAAHENPSKNVMVL